MAKNTNSILAKLICSVLFLLFAMSLPSLTAHFQSTLALLPMHFVVILCGFVCGPAWGAGVGALVPLLRCYVMGAPSMPNAVAMAFELAAYAFIAGLLYKKLDKNLLMHYVALITSMVCGRLVWSAVTIILIFANFREGTIGVSLIWNETVASCIPGIVIQLALIPLIIEVFKKNKLILN